MIIITGATGFLGEHILPKITKQTNEKIRCFVRGTSNLSVFEKYPQIELVFGDFEDPSSLENALEGGNTLINIASIGFGHGPKIVEMCEKNNIQRAIFVSTTAIFTNLNAQTKSIRKKAEDQIKNSNIDWNILRPTMIYGTQKDRNMCRLIKVIKKTPIFPVFGNGTYLQQPIHVDDLAQAIVDVYLNENLRNQEYNLGGKNPLSYNKIITLTAKALGKKVIKLHIPFQLSRLVFKLYEKTSKNPKLKEEQILRLNEDKAFSNEKAIKEFNFKTRTFHQGINDEVKIMKEKNLI